jgi:hypothetical protein
VNTTTVNLSARWELVAAYETLREAVLSSGDGAASRLEGRRLVTEGLLAWGLRYTSPSQGNTSAWDLERHAALQERPPFAAEPAVAVVRLMATMALQSIHPLEARA